MEAPIWVPEHLHISILMIMKALEGTKVYFYCAFTIMTALFFQVFL